MIGKHFLPRPNSRNIQILKSHVLFCFLLTRNENNYGVLVGKREIGNVKCKPEGEGGGRSMPFIPHCKLFQR